MKTFNVIASKRIRLETTIKAENEEQAKNMVDTSNNLDWEDITHDPEGLWIDSIYEKDEV
tara:strand:+ start:280 stop:459 length:180 start_codon:yes stop_codon:yes gene_type:complete